MPENPFNNLNNFIPRIFILLMEDEDVIVWSNDNFLNRSDFKAESNPSKFEDAHSYIKYHHTWTINSEMHDGKIFFVIDNIQLSTLFYRHLSWIREHHNIPYLLKHEQGHFDLAESLLPIIKEKIKIEFKDKPFPTRGQNEEQQKQFAREDSGIIISKELKKWFVELEKKRNQYDEETEFGHNLDKQKEYNEKFERLRK